MLLELESTGIRQDEGHQMTQVEPVTPGNLFATSAKLKIMATGSCSCAKALTHLRQEMDIANVAPEYLISSVQI